MAEFCLACWNKLHGENLTEDDISLSFDLDFCEGCAEWKPVVVSLLRPSMISKFRRALQRKLFGDDG